MRERLDANDGGRAGPKEVCRAFRDLIRAISASTFMVRMGSYTDEDLATLEKRQRQSVGIELIYISCSVFMRMTLSPHYSARLAILQKHTINTHKIYQPFLSFLGHPIQCLDRKSVSPVCFVAGWACSAMLAVVTSCFLCKSMTKHSLRKFS